MDELNLLEDLHREIPGPSAAETARARARLFTAISDPRYAAPRPSVTARGLAVLRRLARPRLWAPVGAAAAVTAVVITAVLITAPTAGPGPQAHRLGSSPRPITAAYVLDKAASAAARQIPGQGPFFVSEAEFISPDRPPAKPYLSAVWSSQGGDVITGFPHAESSPPLPWPITLSQVRHLPSDPVRLLADLAKTRGIAGPPNYVEFWAVCMILAYFPVSPPQRAALYRAVATLSGLRLVSRARDPLGRVAAEVYGIAGKTGPYVSSEVMFFDPATGDLLDYEMYHAFGPITERRCSATPELIALLASGYVGTVVQLPPGAPLSPKPVAQAAVRGCPPVGGPQPTAPARSRS
jgi:hypothetical protein